jgi:hypothetical protein
MAKPGPGGIPSPGLFAPPFAAMQGLFLCQAGPQRPLIFKQLATSPVTGRVASRLPLVRQRMPEMRRAGAR